MIHVTPEGFKFKSFTSQSGNTTFEKDLENTPRGTTNRLIHVIQNKVSNWILICTGDNETPYSYWNTHFAGFIREQEDFRRVLRMCFPDEAFTENIPIQQFSNPNMESICIQALNDILNYHPPFEELEPDRPDSPYVLMSKGRAQIAANALANVRKIKLEFTGTLHP